MSASIDVDVDFSKVMKRLPNRKKMDDVTNKILVALADKLVELIQKRAPVKTGSYRDSWKREKPNDGQILITSDQDMMFNILEFTGRRQLHIEPKEKQALRFEVDGKEIIVMWSNPKRTEPQPHVIPALEELGDVGPKIVRKILKKEIPIFK